MGSESVLPDALITILETLRDPANSPFCADTYLITLKIATTVVQDACREKDSQFLKLAAVFIKFLATPFQEPDVYAIVRERLFREDCDCVESHDFHQIFREDNGPLRGFKRPENLDSFFESACEYINYILSYIRRPSTSITSEIWPRRLAEVIEKRADSLVASMTYWLSRNEGSRELNVLATLIEISWIGISSAISSSTAFWVSFDKCLHRLVSAEYKVLPGDFQPIDIALHGVGGVAFVAGFAFAFGSKTKAPLSLLNAKGRYTDICRLLFMKPLAGRAIRDGRLPSLFFLATFAELLCKSCPGEQLPTHVFPILKEFSRVPDIAYWLQVYFTASDRCHNWRAHSSGSRLSLKVDAERYSLIFKERVKHNKRLQACSGCRAAHYCSTKCQREDWSSGSPSHKTLCPTFQKLFDVHDQASHKSMSLADVEKMYDNLGIPELDIKLAAQHAQKMFHYFSQYESET